MAAPLITLNNGKTIPVVGLGTWQSAPGEVASAVSYALQNGYRHIDGAFMYQNEKEVGEGIQQSGVPRSEVFITSKVWSTFHSRVEECLDKTLAALGTDYIDLYLIHWPVPMNPKGSDPFFPMKDGIRDVDHDWKLSDTWKQMEALVEKGKIRSIGVSNFSEMKLNEILPTAKIVPAVNQLELHLWNPQHKLCAFLREKGIVPQAYSPLGSTNSPLFKDETASKIAEKYGVTTADVLLGFLVANDIVTLPKSVSPARIKSNLDNTLATAKKLKENPTDLEELNGVAASGKQHRFIMPPWPIELGFDNWVKK